jgi:hypothetical protein
MPPCIGSLSAGTQWVTIFGSQIAAATVADLLGLLVRGQRTVNFPTLVEGRASARRRKLEAYG